MALSCYVFARADCECHSLIVDRRFLGLWTSFACGLFCMLEKNLGATMVLLLAWEKQRGCKSVLAAQPQVKLHPHVCISNLFGTWAQHLSRQFLWVWAREGEPAFSGAITCLWWEMEWALPLAVSLQSLLLDCKYFLSLPSSQGLAALKYVVIQLVFSVFKGLSERFFVWFWWSCKFTTSCVNALWMQSLVTDLWCLILCWDRALAHLLRNMAW